MNLLAAMAERPHLVRSAPPGGGYLEALDVSRDGRWIAASDDPEPDAPLRRLHQPAAAQLRRRPAGRGRSRRGSSGRSAPTAAARRHPDGRGSPPSRCACWTRTPCSRRPRSSPSPAAEPVTGVDVQFSADGRYLAATVDVPIGTDVVGLRGGLGPALPDHAHRCGCRPAATTRALALSPDGRTLYTSWPLTAYDVATGERIWREPEQLADHLDVNAEGTLLALARPRDLDECVTGGRGHRRHGRHADGAPGRCTRHPVLEETYLQQTTQVGDSRGVRPRRHLPETGSKWPTAGSTTRARDGSGSSTPSPETATSPSALSGVGWRLVQRRRRLASRRRAVRRVLVRPAVAARRPAPWPSSTPPRANSSGSTRHLSTAMPTSGHWRTWTRVAACSRASTDDTTQDHRRRDPEPSGRAVRPRGELLHDPDRGREHRDGLRVGRGRGLPRTGG